MSTSEEQHVIKLVESAVGVGTPHDGQYVVEYEPAPMNRRGEYEGGKLITSPDATDAKVFDSAGDAFRCWSQQKGFRPDGQPNKPLTAWTAEILRLSEALKEHQ